MFGGVWITFLLSLAFFLGSISLWSLTYSISSAWTNYDANAQTTININAFNSLDHYELLLLGHFLWSILYLYHVTLYHLARSGLIPWRKWEVVRQIWYEDYSIEIIRARDERRTHLTTPDPFLACSISCCRISLSCPSWWKWRRTNDNERFRERGCRYEVLQNLEGHRSS